MTAISICLLAGLFISSLFNIAQYLQNEKLVELYHFQYEETQRLLHEIEELNKRFLTISDKTSAYEIAKSFVEQRKA